MQCPSGAKPHFYTEKIGSRWWICDPAGDGFFLKGVYNAIWNVNNAQTSFITSKYNSGPTTSWSDNWALEQANRVQTWGFNTFAEYSYNGLWPADRDPGWATSDSAIPIKLPFSVYELTTQDAFQNRNGCGIRSPMKDMMNGVGSIYTGWRHNFGDYFDPNFGTCVANVLANDTWGLQLAIKSKYNNYILYLIIDESDQMGPLDNGPDFGAIDSGGQVGSTGHGVVHASWVTLATAPTQTSNSTQGVTYLNETAWTKLTMANDLAAEYAEADCTGPGRPFSCCTAAGAAFSGSSPRTTTCSIDAAASGFIGTTEMSRAISRLNSAWASKYTTLSTTDTDCSANLGRCLDGNDECTASGEPHSWCTGSETGAARIYASFGTGTGLLDENGSCPAKGWGRCWVGDPSTLAGETAAMQADMHAFYVHYLDQYFSVTTGAFRSAAPGYLIQSQLGGWGAPPRREALTEAAKYVDLPIMGNVPAWPCANCTDLQARIDFTARYLGDHPWINFEGFFAQADSAESAHASSKPSLYRTQEQRGAGYQSMISELLTAKDSATGTYHVVGFDWWDLYDMDGFEQNWGLLTPHDNPYDGKSATIRSNGNDQWGHPTGGETASYGDFLSAATKANQSVESQLAAMSGLRHRTELAHP